MNGLPALLLVLIAFDFLRHVTSAKLMEKSTSRCENICDSANLQKDLQGDCQRGCQYFNIEFLVSATDLKKVASIRTYEDRCKSSCLEAYGSGQRRNACFQGCTRMAEIQDQAPYINNWLIYMGASDKGMVLLECDTESLSANDWILLESFLKGDGGVYQGERFKLNETFITEGKEDEKEHFLLNLTFHSWLLFIPFMMVMWVIWKTFGGTSSCPSPDDFSQNPSEVISNVVEVVPSLSEYSEFQKHLSTKIEEDQDRSKQV